MSTYITYNKLVLSTIIGMAVLSSNAYAEYYIEDPVYPANPVCNDCYREVIVRNCHPHKHRKHHKVHRPCYPVRHSAASISVYYNTTVLPCSSCSTPSSNCCYPWGAGPSYYSDVMYPARYVVDDDYNWDRRTWDDAGAQLNIDY